MCRPCRGPWKPQYELLPNGASVGSADGVCYAAPDTPLCVPTRPDVKLVVEPLLREYNRHQRAGKPLYARHVGTPMGDLKDAFNSRHPGFVWPSDVGPDDAWWEPHGNFTLVCRARPRV